MSEDEQGFKTESTKYAHDVNLERKCVEGLLECDARFFREATLLPLERSETVDSSSPQGKTPALPASKLGAKHKTGANTLDNDPFFTGWGPHAPSLSENGKQGKNYVSKTKESRYKDHLHRHSRDYKYKCSKDSFVFRHYRDSRKYMEQYRLENACGATIHISKRVLSASSSQKLHGFPRDVHVYQVFSPSHVRKKDGFSFRDYKDQLSDNKLENSRLKNSTSTIVNPSSDQHEISTKSDENSSARSSRLIDPAIVFKYKLAPNYVQNILQQRKKLLKQQSEVEYDSRDKSAEESDNDLTSVEVRGRVCSAKQSISSRGRAEVNLAPTKISFSSLPSVPVIVSQSINQTPISALAEKVVVNQSFKRTEPILPGGGVKTLDNLATLTGGDKQADATSDGEISISELSTTCLAERREVTEVDSKRRFTVIVANHIKTESDVMAKLQAVPKEALFEAMGGTVPKERIFHPPAGRPPKFKPNRPVLVKFMSKEGILKQAMVDLKPSIEETLPIEFLSLANHCGRAVENFKQLNKFIKTATKSEHRRSAKTPEGRKRFVRSASEEVPETLDNCDAVFNGPPKCYLDQPKPPPVPFFKFWGGSLPPEARSQARKETKSRSDSSLTDNKILSDVTGLADDPKVSRPTSRSIRQCSASSGKKKTGPAIASGKTFKDLKNFPWKENVGILKELSEEKKYLTVRPKMAGRSSSFVMTGIQEGISYDDNGLHSQGFRSSPVRRRLSQASGGISDSVSGRSSAVSGILSKVSLFSTVYSEKGSVIREDTNSSNADNGINDFAAEVTTETDQLRGRLAFGERAHSYDTLQTDQPHELKIKTLLPKSKMELLFLPRIAKTDPCLVHNKET